MGVKGSCSSVAENGPPSILAVPAAPCQELGAVKCQEHGEDKGLRPFLPEVTHYTVNGKQYKYNYHLTVYISKMGLDNRSSKDECNSIVQNNTAV